MRPPKKVSSHRQVFHGGPFSIKNPDSRILDFSSSISPIGPPPSVKTRLKKRLDTYWTYPDPDSKNLREALQQYTGIAASQIVAGNGATEIIYNFCQAFVSGTAVLIPVPTFGEYEAASRLHGGKVAFFKTMNLNHDLAEFIRAIPGHGCVFLCNPNNPTGTLTLAKNIKQIIHAAAKKSTLVFVDECFIELAAGPDASVSRLVRRCKNLLVLRSLTKSFGLAGMRVGYALGSKTVIETLNRIKIPWNVSGPAQEAARAALSDRSYIDKVRKMLRAESSFLQRRISDMEGFACVDTDANFILVRTRLRSGTVQRRLLKSGILVRDCSSFRGLGGNFVRIAIRTRGENKKLIRAMEKI